MEEVERRESLKNTKRQRKRKSERGRREVKGEREGRKEMAGGVNKMCIKCEKERDIDKRK